MSDIYITGHRNPDLDSVCSAYAYARLKNILDPENHYIPIRCGHLGDSARQVLENLKLEIPGYKRDLYPRVSDVLLRSDEHFDASMPLTAVAHSYKDSNPSVIPIYKDDAFYGLLSVDDITSWAMSELGATEKLDYIPTIGEIMREQEEPVHMHDLFEEAKNKLASSKKRGLAVVDDHGFVGYVTRRCFLRKPRYNVILVDHNEPKQSIKGIEEANIVEIIDHHRLDAVKTELPIYIDAEPLGSTCTIVYQLFMRNNIKPDLITAQVLLTGVIADTLILKSPTTTTVDVMTAEALAQACGVDLQEFGMQMFSSLEGLKTREPESAISADFKMYTEKSIRFGIGQCEVTTLHDLPEYEEMYLKALENVRMRNGLDWAVLMITDVLREHSVLLTTDHNANRHLQYTCMKAGVYDMPGVMSRKKQLLPEAISAVSHA